MEMWQKIILGVGMMMVAGFVFLGIFSEKADAPKNTGGSNEDAGNPSASVVYYYGDGCPHCNDLQKFLDENGVEFGDDLAKKEVWENETNRDEMNERAKSCGLTKRELGVPFVFAEGKCFMGLDAKKYFEGSSFLRK